jgi:hypothetical protein
MSAGSCSTVTPARAATGPVSFDRASIARPGSIGAGRRCPTAAADLAFASSIVRTFATAPGSQCVGLVNVLTDPADAYPRSSNLG